MNMKTIGYIEEERLQFIPQSLWLSHEFCFYLHDQLVNLLLQYENSGIHNSVIEAISTVSEQHNIDLKDFDIIKFLKEINDEEPYKHHIFSHVIMGLTSDMLHFLHESLKCFEKHKISVAFSLLRKPLKEHLLFLSWILADENDFLKRFEANNYKSLSGLGKEKQLDILKKATSKVIVKEMFDPELIWEIIYSKKHENGFEPTWQRATHLVTSYGDLLKTEDYNINFIFENSIDGYFHEFLYQKLPYILQFISQVTFECFSKIHPLNNKTIDHLILTTMGCYASLFSDGRKQSITRLFQKNFKDFLQCIHCKSDIKIKKKYAPLFYIQEQLYCENCNSITEFPLYWLMAKTGLSITNEEQNV